MLLLLIEDDEDLGRALVRALTEDGFEVRWILRGDEGLYRAKDWDHDLVILDRMLPGLEGLEVLKQLRARKRVPVLMLTALNSLQNRIEGFDGGADDYLGKPFELAELLARVRALLRRSSQWRENGLSHGNVRLDPGSRRAYLDGSEVALTASEFATVELMLSRRGRVISKQMIEDRLHTDGTEVGANSVEVHVHRIRAKLGRDFIQTRRGLGYIVDDPAPAKTASA